MKIADIPHNMKFKFGPNLREVPKDQMGMLQGMLYIKEQLNNDTYSDHEKSTMHGLLGYFLRIIGEIEDSKKHLNTAIELAEKTDNQQSVFVNKIRLANTYQWENNFKVSNKMFEELMDTADKDPHYRGYLDFVYEHYGKNLFDQKEFQRALDYFNKALEIRKEKGNEDLISATEHAIATCSYKF
ncbi:tetratricopeptide repeat protein [Virgibacillus doumboii]|uniref:tetratricopeptide repeat protein n=1 Tax=Virgibacillus doumboii TaxID=2697503 RepID=UPI001FE29067|nr:tetratricopeptide repeat protein [Virgibacillus doumboii]